MHPLVGRADVSVRSTDNTVLASDYRVHNGPVTNVFQAPSEHRLPSSSISRTTETSLSNHRTPLTPPLPTNSCEVYTQELLVEGRGYPLWRPAPIESDPSDFKQHGVKIGDVGVVDSEGRFKFLFNICEARNSSTEGQLPVPLPHGFVKIRPEDVERDPSYFRPGDYVKSKDYFSVLLGHSQEPNEWVTEAKYASMSLQGAILHIPAAGIREELVNLRLFRELAASHAKSWYQIAYNILGWDDLNGALYLVTGHVKSCAWAAAAHHGSGTHSPVSLSLQATRSDSVLAYRWVHEGSAEAKWGPSPIQGPPTHNQCLFIRGFKIKLRFLELGMMQWERGVHLANVMGRSDSKAILTERSALPRSAASVPFNVRTTSHTSVKGRSGTQELHHDTLHYSHRLYHPSDAINDFLLQNNLSAEMAITHDSEWMNATASSRGSILQPARVLQWLIERYPQMTGHSQVVYFDQGAFPDFNHSRFRPSSCEYPEFPSYFVPDNLVSIPPVVPWKLSLPISTSCNPTSLRPLRMEGPRRPRRVSIACVLCRQRRIRCVTNGAHDTCERCLRRGLDCSYIPAVHSEVTAPDNHEPNGPVNPYILTVPQNQDRSVDAEGEGDLDTSHSEQQPSSEEEDDDDDDDI